MTESSSPVLEEDIYNIRVAKLNLKETIHVNNAASTATLASAPSTASTHSSQSYSTVTQTLTYANIKNQKASKAVKIDHDVSIDADPLSREHLSNYNANHSHPCRHAREHVPSFQEQD